MNEITRRLISDAAEEVPPNMFLTRADSQIIAELMERLIKLTVLECADKVVQPFMSRWPEDHALTTQVKEHFGI